MASKRKAAMVESMPKKAKLLKTSTPRFQKTSVSATVEIDQKFARNNRTLSKNDYLDHLRKIQYLLRDGKPSNIEAVGGETEILPTCPSIFIKSYGYLPLPVNQSVVETLNKTPKLINTVSKNIIEINSELIEIKNPKWNDMLNPLLDQIANGLKCTGVIEAKLNKLVINGTGKGFSHQIYLNQENAFATLVLQLPSFYVGK